MLSRRQLLSIGAVSAAGLGFPDLLPAASQAARAKSVLLVYCFGGPSHLDMWDMKPDGPSAIRGSFKPVATRLAGVPFCEHLPRLATLNDRFSLVRSVSHDRNVHGGAVGYALTGTKTRDPGVPGVRGPDATPEDHPAPGAAIMQLSPLDGPVPTAVTLPWEMIDGQGRYVPGQNGGMLGRAFDPWLLKTNPNDPKARVEGLALATGLSVSRLDDRRALLRSLDEQTRRIDDLAQTQPLDAYYDRAFSLITSTKTRDAIDLSSEPATLRDRYGRNTFGQSCLVGRRLIEAGVRCVQVNMGNSLFGDYGWDTHSDNFNHMQKKLLPKFDPGFSTLLEDMDDRGLLEETLVVCMGEFGRTPKIASNGGRDHWPQCYTVLFAGAGVRRGGLVGKSDAQGAYPIEHQVGPEDVIATIYGALGINPRQPIRDPLGRSHTLVSGTPIAALY